MNIYRSKRQKLSISLKKKNVGVRLYKWQDLAISIAIFTYKNIAKLLSSFWKKRKKDVGRFQTLKTSVYLSNHRMRAGNYFRAWSTTE